MKEFPNFPLEKVTVKFITIKSARGHSYKACELALAQLASKRFPLGEGHDPPLRSEGRRSRDPVGGREGRAGRDSRFSIAVAIEKL
jgi:hypothetical protein